MAVPESNLLITVIHDFGFQILNVTKLIEYRTRDQIFRKEEVILAEFNFMNLLIYIDQRYKEKGPLVVHAALSNWPNTLYFITNYGMMVIEFPVKITS
jgi:hypothetical protein